MNLLLVMHVILLLLLVTLAFGERVRRGQEVRHKLFSTLVNRSSEEGGKQHKLYT